MKGRERTQRALRGEPTDRPALASLFLGGAHHVTDRMGTRLREVYRDAGRIAEAQLVAAELFGHDTAMAPWGCLTVEAEAFGCGLEWHDDYYPRVASHPLEEDPDPSRLRIPDPSTAGRMPLVLDSLARIRERAGEELFIIGMVVSPFLVAAEVRGMVALLSDFVMEPPRAEALLERVTTGIAGYVRAMASTGAADAIMFENAGACREMMGPQHVSRFVMPHERRLLAAAREADHELLLIEHNCSDTPYFGEILDLDVDAVSFAHGDVRTIARTENIDCLTAHSITNACLDRVCLRPAERRVAWIGNVDNARIMLEASPVEVEREARACVASAEGGPFVLSTSCEIPFKAPIENIVALARATRAEDLRSPGV